LNPENNNILVNNPIGNGPTSVEVILYDDGCETVISDPLLVVIDEAYDVPFFTYGIEIDVQQINSSPLVSFTNSNSEGFIKFCARVVSKLGTLDVRFRETNLQLAFDISESSFSLDVTAVTNTQDSTEEFFATDYAVEACICDPGSLDCIPPSLLPTYNENSYFNVCLVVTDDGISTNAVEIVNFSLQLEGSDGSYMFDAVSFGTTTWSPNPLSTVSVGLNSFNFQSVTTKTRFVAGLFTDILPGDSYVVPITGNATLAFASAKNEEFDLQEIGLEISVTVPKDEDKGCGGALRGMLGRLQKSFRTE